MLYPQVSGGENRPAMTEADALMQRAGVHPEWREILGAALASVDRDYLHSLLRDASWLPGVENLLAAFRRDRQGLKYLLIGESPYPRRESANGIAFYDAAVGELWSEQGLSKPVNRATSLRNLVKTALLAEGYLRKDDDGKISQQAIAALDKQGLVQTLGDLFDNLHAAGFLLLNATPVLHPERKPAQEAGYWQDFLERLLAAIADDAIADDAIADDAIADEAREPLTLLLWGKIAQRVEAMPASAGYRKLVCEHPYNVSFIDNPAMQQLFARLELLRARA
jgi:uracil-DNA glycosylase